MFMATCTTVNERKDGRTCTHLHLIHATVHSWNHSSASSHDLSLAHQRT